MDGMWRALGYETYPASSPSVTVVKVKTPEEINSHLNDKNLCDLYVYFKRHLHHKNLKFTEFYTLMDTSYTKPKRYEYATESSNFYIIYENWMKKPVYVYKRLNPKARIVRMNMMNILSGEKWYLRQLLLHSSPVSFEDLRTINKVTYPTFQQAAMAKGIIRNNNECMTCFREALIDTTPPQLRTLLVTLTMQGFPTLQIYNDEELRIKLHEDFIHDPRFANSPSIALNELKKDLEKRFLKEGSSAATYGFPESENVESELQLYRLTYKSDEYSNILTELLRKYPNTTVQEELFQSINHSLTNNETRKIFIQGIAGAGKTTFAQKIIALGRSLGKIVLGCSSTNLSAQL